MHCGRVSNLLSAYIDRELAGTEMLQIRRHLDLCSGCAAELESLRRVKSVLSAAPPHEPSGDVVAAVMRRWSERGEDARAPRRHEAVSVPRWNWKWMRWSPPPQWHRYGLALTAFCLFMAVAATAMALRKPNYPDTLAANIVPLLAQPDERFSLPDAPYATVNWVPRQRSIGWQSAPDFGAAPLLVSETPFPWGR
jgi:putative zinc finger protein